MRKAMTATLVLALLGALPALAGEHQGTKCQYDTQTCLNMMASRMKNSGWIGVELEKSDETGALTVSAVIPDSPAEKSGVRAGDVLYAIDGIVLNDQNEEKIQAAMKEWKPGRSISYTIKRDGQDRKASLTLAPMPADLLAKYIGQHMLEHAQIAAAAK
ncbi:MAG TPA: PDZ domain-containing protein [Candidatus Saccharimonadales bacterium]|nr:PDZ domain-containing protein [Candidatus Saccharimonadales bacterium]